MDLIVPIAVSVSSTSIADPTNAGYMFDEFLDTQSSDTDSITVEIDASNCDRVCLFNLNANSISIQLTDDDESEVVQTPPAYVLGADQTSIIIPIYIFSNATVQVVIDKTGGTAWCGYCRTCLSTNIGITQWGFKPGAVDYSVKDNGAYGDYLSQGAWARENDFRLLINPAAADFIADDLTDVRGTIVCLDGNEEGIDYDAARLLGYVKDWKVIDEDDEVVWLDLEFKGVI
jgi:hypothetical protein